MFISKQIKISVDVNPAMIISGLEPGRTRYLLQLFTVVAMAKCLGPKGDEKMALLHDSQNATTHDVIQSLQDEDGRPVTMDGNDEKIVFEVENLPTNLFGGSVLSSNTIFDTTETPILNSVAGCEPGCRSRPIIPSLLPLKIAEVNKVVNILNTGFVEVPVNSLLPETQTRPSSANDTRSNANKGMAAGGESVWMLRAPSLQFYDSDVKVIGEVVSDGLGDGQATSPLQDTSTRLATPHDSRPIVNKGKVALSILSGVDGGEHAGMKHVVVLPIAGDQRQLDRALLEK